MDKQILFFCCDNCEMCDDYKETFKYLPKDIEVIYINAQDDKEKLFQKYKVTGVPHLVFLYKGKKFAEVIQNYRMLSEKELTEVFNKIK